MLKYNWSLPEITTIYEQPLSDLIYEAQSLHRQFFPRNQIQRSTLLSVKTGGCPEDCAYCPQSAHYKTDVERHAVLSKEIVIEKAREAKEGGSTRFCMGAAWREVRDGNDFEQILELVKAVAGLGLEVCCTLGMLNLKQARQLKDAGCYAYNHNLDTSPEFYAEIITTRTYQDRLETLKNVRRADITVCCGGIVGMGESVEDRLSLLFHLATQNPHPESVPINMLVRVKGTPLEQKAPVDPIEFARLVGTARIIMPRSFVRLSAGRMEMSDEMHALCFLAGANSIFSGEKLLTTPNPTEDRDHQLLKRLGMTFLGERNSKSELGAH